MIYTPIPLVIGESCFFAAPTSQILIACRWLPLRPLAKPADNTKSSATHAQIVSGEYQAGDGNKKLFCSQRIM
jgi:hypothetical protein